jgi:hypothetical protein
VSLIPQPASTPSQIAAATIEAAKGGVNRAANDNGVIDTFWLLTQIPLAARQEDFSGAMQRLGLSVPKSPTAFDVLAALSQAIEQSVVARRERSDFSEIALAAAQEALSELCVEETRSLFAASPEEIRNSFRKYSTSTQFRRLARVFFKGFTARYLKTFLSRELSNHVGATEKFEDVRQHSGFNEALDRHCFETAKIVEEFAGGWFSKTNFERGIDRDAVRSFLHVALQKIAEQLRREGVENA